MTVRQLEPVLNEKKISISLFTDKICDKKQQQLIIDIGFKIPFHFWT